MLRPSPQRVGRDVSADYRRSAIRGRAAGTGTRSNWHQLHLPSPLVRQFRTRDDIQVDAVGIHQQDRSKRTRSLILDYPAQCIEDLFQWHPGGDHLEELFLSLEQRFGSLSLVNVHIGAIPTDNLA